ncbi:type I DNA topoisomerase [candidate division KSB1 bacterium]|nr:type I DNA topoisomerase [candidate division KSB1 bacterium]
MGKYLVIVESKAKTKTISKILGKDYTILASIGHVKDLPKNKLGVDIEDGFQPHYITIRGKGPVLSDLRKTAMTSEQVFIATDPDREGEAIAWHIADEIRTKNSNIKRVLFNEITQTGILKGMSAPMDIDFEKVEAQKARRVLDRLVGYQVSPLLWKTIYRGLSAGRVQSVALRLICEREAEIQAFVSQEYWSITAELAGQATESFLSNLVKVNQKAAEIPDQKTALDYVTELKTCQYAIKQIRKKEISKNPPPPFTTSTLQQEASKRLGYSTKKIMQIAQTLYEGVEIGEEGSVGVITYMRTDSTRIAEEAVTAVREFIYNNYGKEYLPAKARVFKVKASAQDAHEAIRPTSMKRAPKSIRKYLSEDQYQIYELIWNRFVASQMAAARMEQTTIEIEAVNPNPTLPTPHHFLFRTTGSIYLFRGYLQVFQEVQEDSDNAEENQPIPLNLHEGERLVLKDLIPKQHFTKPPARYSESTLVKELDALGIGRPSTYAVIISTLFARKYIGRDKRQLFPTELGITVNKILIQQFPGIFSVTFTAQMEGELDKVESGEKKYLEVVNDFFVPFNAALQATDSQKDAIRDSLVENTTEICPKCGKPLITRWGRNGKFTACSGYPDCKFTKAQTEAQATGETCEKCGKPMLLKVSRFGRFLACSGYPECKSTQPYRIGVTCPKSDCGGHIVERKTKQGKIFYGCSRYPKCDFVSWYRPVSTPCPQCSHGYVEERYTEARGEYLRCPACKNEFEMDQARE